MEHKSSREKAWVASKNKNNRVITGDNLSNEINNLQDDSFVEMEEMEEEPVPLTEEEKLEIRKKIGALLVLVFVIFVALIVIFVFDPFAPKRDNKTNEEPSEIVDDDTTLYDYEDGDIQRDDVFITQMYKEIKFNYIDFYEFDTYFLYKNDKTSINDLTDNEKTILASKSVEFQKIIDGLSNNYSICEEDIRFDATELSSVALVKYGTVLNLLPSFKYNYYYNNSYVDSIKFELKGNEYIGKCYEHNKNVVNVLEQELKGASKSGNNVYLDVRVAFINQNGIYKDPNFKELITNDPDATSTTYMKNARVYRYTYVVSEDRYYLDNVSLLK